MSCDHDLRGLRNRLLDKKQAERAQALRDLGEWLSRADMRDTLDRNTTDSHADPQVTATKITWPIVLASCRQALDVELQSLDDARAKNQKTVGQKQQHVQATCQLLKQVITTADRGGRPMFGGKDMRDLYRHIEGAIKDRICEGFINGYSQLLADLLKNPEYRKFITHKTWTNLMSVYTALLENLPVGTKRDKSLSIESTICAKVIYRLVSSCERDLLPYADKLRDFFEGYYGRAEMESQAAVRVLQALNYFVRHIGLNAREMLVHLHQRVRTGIFELWKTRREDSKRQVVVYLRTMLRLHYADGLPPIQFEGLYTVHELLLTDLKGLLGQVFFNHDPTHPARLPTVDYQRHCFADLAAYVIARVEAARQTEGEDKPDDRRAKRARLHSFWDSLEQGLRATSSPSVIPWLVVLRTLTVKHGHIISERLTQLVEMLLQRLGALSSDKIDIMASILHCLQALAAHSAMHGSSSGDIWERAVTLWVGTARTTLATSTCARVLVCLAMERGCTLLDTLVRGQLLSDQSLASLRANMGALFVPGLCQPTHASISLLVALIQTGDPPELEPATTTPASSHPTPGFSLVRTELARWALSGALSDTNEPARSLSPSERARTVIFSSQSTTVFPSATNTGQAVSPFPVGWGWYVGAALFTLMHRYHGVRPKFAPQMHEKAGRKPRARTVEIEILRAADLCDDGLTLEQREYERGLGQILAGVFDRLGCPVGVSEGEDKSGNTDVWEEREEAHLFSGLYLQNGSLIPGSTEAIGALLNMLGKRVDTGSRGIGETPEKELRRVGYAWTSILATWGLLLHYGSLDLDSILSHPAVFGLQHMGRETAKLVPKNPSALVGPAGAPILDHLKQMFRIFCGCPSANQTPCCASMAEQCKSLLKKVCEADMKELVKILVQILHGGRDLEEEYGEGSEREKDDMEVAVDNPSPSGNPDSAEALSATSTIVNILSLVRTVTGFRVGASDDQYPDEDFIDSNVAFALTTVLDRFAEQGEAAAPVPLSIMPLVCSMCTCLLTSRDCLRHVGASMHAVDRLLPLWTTTVAYASILPLMNHVLALSPQLQIARRQKQPEGKCHAETLIAHKLILMHSLWGHESAPLSHTVRALLVECLVTWLQIDPNCLLWPEPETEQQKTPSEMLHCAMLDLDWRVRLVATHGASLLLGGSHTSVGLVLSSLTSVYEILAHAAEDLRKEGGQPFECASVLLAVAEMGVSVPACTPLALVLLCREASLPNISEYAQGIVQKYGDLIGYQDTKALASDNMAYLANTWVGELGRPLYDIPFRLLGYPTYPFFLKANMPVLVATAVLQQNEEMLRVLALETAQPPKDLLATHSSLVLATILPLGTNSGQWKFLLKYTPESILLDTYSSDRCGLLLCLLLLLREPPDTHPPSIEIEGDGLNVPFVNCILDTDPEGPTPNYGFDQIRKAMEELKNEVLENPLKQPAVVHRLFFALSKGLATTKKPEEERHLLTVLSFALECLGSDLSKSYSYRAAVTTLLRSTHKGENTQIAVRLLGEVCIFGLSQCPAVLATHLRHIIGSLLPLCSLADGPTRPDDGVTDQVVDLLERLLIQNKDGPKWLSEYSDAVRELEPLPEGVRFARVNRALKRMAGELDLEEQIKRFTSNGQGTQTIARVETLRHLCQQLREHRDQLADLLQADSRIQQGNQRIVSRLVGSLIQACRPEMPSDVREMAGRCLGELGPVDLNTVTFAYTEPRLVHASAPLQPDKGSLRRSSSSGPFSRSNSQSKAAAAAASAAADDRTLNVLHHLNSLLADSDIAVVEAAAACLRGLLEQAPVQAVAAGEPILAQQLAPFQPHKAQHTEGDMSTLKGDVVLMPLYAQDLWMCEGAGQQAYSDWIRTLCCALISDPAMADPTLTPLLPICARKTQFCEFILPFLFHSVLLSASRNTVDTISSNIAEVFHRARHSGTQTHNPTATRALLDVLSFLRDQPIPPDKIASTMPRERKPQRQKQGQATTAFDSNFWLALDFQDVAWAAFHCGAYFTALLYLELWCDVESIDLSNVAPYTDDSQAQPYQQLLQNIYSHINEPDGLSGATFSLSLDSQIRTHTHNREWGGAAAAYDLLLQMQGKGDERVEGRTDTVGHTGGLMQSLERQGNEYTLMGFWAGLSSRQPQLAPALSDHEYEMAWRATRWGTDQTLMSSGPTLNHPNDTTMTGDFSPLSRPTAVHRLIYESLRGYKEGSPKHFAESLMHTHRSLVGTIGQATLESVKTVYPLMSSLQSVVEMAEAWPLRSHTQDTPTDLLGLGPVPQDGLRGISPLWESRLALAKGNSFEVVEPVLALRESLLVSALSTRMKSGADCSDLKAQLASHLATYADLARASHQYQQAKSALYRMRLLVTSALGWMVPMAKVLWASGQHSDALRWLTAALNDNATKAFGNVDDARLQAQAMLLNGKWLAERRFMTHDTIIDQYLRPAVDATTQYDPQNVGKAYNTLATFADTLYQSLANQMATLEWEEKVATRAKQQDDLVRARAAMLNGQFRNEEERRDLARMVRQLERQLNMDAQAEAVFEANRSNFLGIAMQNYLLCLTTSNRYDLSVCRTVALWFETNREEMVNMLVEEHLDNLPTFKFLPIMYQVAARMASDTTGPLAAFNKVHFKLIEKVVRDHPHHCVYMILALCSTDSSEGANDKAQTARKVFQKVRGSSINHKQLLDGMNRLNDAYADLAAQNLSEVDKRNGAIQPIRAKKFLQIKSGDLAHVAVPTSPPPISQSAHYSDYVGVRSFGSEYLYVGGINVPKAIDCFGTDGQVYRQLVKGRDDLRQDAVMQQVFNMVNLLLLKHPATQKRNLILRTYWVVPMSPQHGVLEWVKNTMPIGDWLVKDETNAHSRYRPNDMKPGEVRNGMRNIEQKSPEHKLAFYREVMQKLKPVFRYFFLERYRDSAEWFERRLTYTRSVAVWSMVGHVVGLGDRHVQNILIDAKTSELIHIDFGVAFDQGKLLPTPERVPFRLTRDMVDGMGVLGVEGTFRRCCEQALLVMRASQATILTILDVLLHDPLYSWAISSKVLKKQQGDDEETSEVKGTAYATAASRHAAGVLRRLKEKLNGMEQNVGLSVEGQVSHLIQEATSPNNLALMYYGWQAYL